MDDENILMDKLPLAPQDPKKERLIEFFKSDKFTDCTFVIEGVTVKAHKLILACHSLVFESMFFGDLAQTTVDIYDINLVEFNQMLEFVYTDEVNITSVSNAWAIYYIANKYLLEGLQSICLDYVRRNISASTLAMSYEYAEMYDLVELKYECFWDMEHFLKVVFWNDYHMKPSTLRTILQNETFNVAYPELFIKSLQWAVTECDVKQLPMLPENIINILHESKIIQFIQKLWITIQNCYNCDGNILYCECYDEIIHKTVRGIDQLTKHCDREKLRMFQLESTKKQLNICCFRKVYKISKRLDLRNAEEFVTHLAVSKKVVLLGFLVNTQMMPDHILKDDYKGSITIRVCLRNSDIVVDKPTTICKKLFYDSERFVVLKDLVTLYPNITYAVRISYENFTTKDSINSFVCYYMSNKLVLPKHKETVLCFYEMSGTIIKGVSFYPA